MSETISILTTSQANDESCACRSDEPALMCSDVDVSRETSDMDLHSKGLEQEVTPASVASAARRGPPVAGGGACNTPPATYTGQQSAGLGCEKSTWHHTEIETPDDRERGSVPEASEAPPAAYTGGASLASGKANRGWNHCTRSAGDEARQGVLTGLGEAPPAAYREDGSIEIVAVGVDTLELNFYGGYRPEVDQLVDARMAAAELRASGDGSGVEVKLGGVTLTVRGGGRRMYWGLATCSDFHVEFMRQTPKQGSQQPPIRLKFLSSFLWREGWQSAAEMVVRWVGEHLLVDDEHYRHQVSRVDLAVDSQGYAPSVGDVEARYVRRTGQPLHKAAPDGVTLESAYWGSRTSKGVFFRLYNKSKELRDNPGKAWFSDVWGAQGAYDPDLTVWRTEVQLRREALKTFRRGSAPDGEPTGDEPMVLETVEDLEQALPTIWRYITTRWLRMVEQGETDSNKWRAPLHPWWAALQDADWGEVPVEVIRVTKAKAKYEQMLPQLAGTLETTIAAAVAAGMYDAPEDLKDLSRLFTWEGGRIAVRTIEDRQRRRKQGPMESFKKKLAAMMPAIEKSERGAA
jgi:hypothetical protein